MEFKEAYKKWCVYCDEFAYAHAEYKKAIEQERELFANGMAVAGDNSLLSHIKKVELLEAECIKIRKKMDLVIENLDG